LLSPLGPFGEPAESPELEAADADDKPLKPSIKLRRFRVVGIFDAGPSAIKF
jgi:hypothetical protein